LSGTTNGTAKISSKINKDPAAYTTRALWLVEEEWRDESAGGRAALNQLQAKAGVANVPLDF
jgi:hypothetical protein